MAQITVQLQNGMVGTMDDSEFNPSTMKQLGSPAGTTATSQGYSMPSAPQSQQSSPSSSNQGLDVNSLRQRALQAIQADPAHSTEYATQFKDISSLMTPSDQEQITNQLAKDAASGMTYSQLYPTYARDKVPEALIRAAYLAGPVGQKYGQPTESAAELAALASGKPEGGNWQVKLSSKNVPVPGLINQISGKTTKESTPYLFNPASGKSVTPDQNGNIHVTDIGSGQAGWIPIGEFDSNKYTPL